MKKNTKGYTLIELLVSIAVFAIVMVGIVSIMSTSVSVYSKGNLDVSIQEDAQIVANTLEEILCDATSISTGSSTVHNDVTNTEVGVSGYKCECVKLNYNATQNKWSTPGKDRYFFYTLNNKLYYILNGGSPVLLASNVKYFTIENYNQDKQVTLGSDSELYNQAVIKITFDNKETTYNLSRNVYFRNPVENVAFNSIDNFKGGSNSGGNNDGSISLDVKRFHTYNLTADYQIRYDCKIYKDEVEEGGPSVGSDPTTAVYDDTFFTLSAANDGPKLTSGYEDATTYYLKTSSGVNKLKSSALQGKSFKITGYKDKAKTQQVVINLDVVDISIKSDGVLAQQHKDGDVNGEGFQSPIEVTGIDINEGLKIGKDNGGINMKARYGFKNSSGTIGVNEFNSFNPISACFDGRISDYSDYVWEYKIKQSIYNTSYSDNPKFGLAPDPFSGGLMAIGPNSRLNSDGQGKSLIGKKDLWIYYDVDIEGQGFTYDLPVFTVKYTALGTGL
ncbi:prepilin-type N-terminal cleavage/methylation domain-containing protein [Lachnospiraceae bacterium G41]|nr:prepilin-type N-terminal cleavage/methylation domain-containing protein [Lachnospiraceae bacterium G41]